jgi:hypothetical protein
MISGMFIPTGSYLWIFSIPDPDPGSRGQKAPDTGSGSATLVPVPLAAVLKAWDILKYFFS